MHYPKCLHKMNQLLFPEKLFKFSQVVMPKFQEMHDGQTDGWIETQAKGVCPANFSKMVAIKVREHLSYMGRGWGGGGLGAA